jgi:predicted DCC family thiol-disulfide oxidoreductase YuxK
VGEPYSYRRDPTVPAFADDRPIIIFDGDCAMCSGSARFVLRHDRRGAYRLLAAQSDLGRALYVHYGLDPRNFETMILLEAGQPSFKSEAGLRIARRLDFPWNLLVVLRSVPRALRDGVYDVVARNRLRMFGRRERCYVSDPRHADRFLA